MRCRPSGANRRRSRCVNDRHGRAPLGSISSVVVREVIEGVTVRWSSGTIGMIWRWNQTDSDHAEIAGDSSPWVAEAFAAIVATAAHYVAYEGLDAEPVAAEPTARQLIGGGGSAFEQKRLRRSPHDRTEKQQAILPHPVSLKPANAAGFRSRHSMLPFQNLPTAPNATSLPELPSATQPGSGSPRASTKAHAAEARAPRRRLETITCRHDWRLLIEIVSRCHPETGRRARPIRTFGPEPLKYASPS
jgi:hypothetical protein